MSNETTEVGRPQRLPRDQRRAQLLESAQHVFVERGYHAAGMEDIAERAGVSKPVLYQHFPGKLELYLAILDHQVELLESMISDALAQAGDAKEKVYATFGAYFDFVTREGGAFRLVFESDLTKETAVRERLDRVERECAHIIAEHIVMDTGLPDEYATLLSIALAGMAQVTARGWLALDTQITKEDAARAAAHLAWRGLGNYPTRATTNAAGLPVGT
ncbi:TetR/AcrR family transcriptional regulator [Kribbia dieselivorans]|uniref:TetR/AcrR family transcriptional regulator n=1 Tax=Kribbia dieselivorans TaxID=331526 RepID=UPI000838AC99|nr:TetR/AcrR family transcriptional regulator [Kribbia dieselivorans]